MTIPEISNIPIHVAIIMDGNGRWAQKRGLPRLAGHKAGTDNIRPTVKRFADEGVRYLTVYAFSTENWGRPDPEVKGLLGILEEVVGIETPRLHKDGVKLQHIGSLEGLSEELQRAIRNSVELTKNNTRITLNVAFNYGGRAEIIAGVKRLIQEGIDPEKLDEVVFDRYLYTADLPDPDLIIRTAGEMRLSNFLIWQAAYSEYYSTPVYWPDFGKEEVHKALAAYAQRQRRFGGL